MKRTGAAGVILCGLRNAAGIMTLRQLEMKGTVVPAGGIIVVVMVGPVGMFFRVPLVDRLHREVTGVIDVQDQAHVEAQAARAQHRSAQGEADQAECHAGQLHGRLASYEALGGRSKMT